MNKEKFKDLNFKEKIEWLLHYYGVAFIAGLVVLFVAIVFIRSVFFPEPLSDVCVLVLSDELLTEDATSIQTTIENKTGKTASVSVFYTDDIYGRQSFSTKLTADELDIIVAPKEEAMGMVENEYLTEYEEIEGTNLYIGTSYRAREGQLINDTYKIIEDIIEKEGEK